MILEKIYRYAHGNPNKQAIVYKGKSLTYAELFKEINRRKYSISKISENILLLSASNELDNFLNFLTGMALRKISVFSSKHLNTKQLDDLSKREKAFILDEKFDFDTTISSEFTLFPSSNHTLFLGVLTSGTTDTPNLIWKDYQSWFTAFKHQSDVFGIKETDRLFVLDALSYSANLNSALHMLWANGTVVFTSLNTANTWPKQIENEQITAVFMVPSHYRLLVQNAKENTNITSVVSAGEKLDQEIATKLLKYAPNAILTEYYGSAELGHITYHQGVDILANPLSVGRPFPEVNITLKNEQIFVDSPYISPDYRKNKTNFDLGYFIDHRLILLGRAGRMFNRRGLNVFAEEIENTVKKLPYIIEAAVIGQLQDDHSHELFLAYTCSGGFQNNNYNKFIFNHLASHLQATKIPQRLKEFENLPRTNFGKIDFKALARTFDEEAYMV